jgi:hypothetical protein
MKARHLEALRVMRAAVDVDPLASLVLWRAWAGPVSIKYLGWLEVVETPLLG